MKRRIVLAAAMLAGAISGMLNAADAKAFHHWGGCNSCCEQTCGCESKLRAPQCLAQLRLCRRVELRMRRCVLSCGCNSVCEQRLRFCCWRIIAICLAGCITCCHRGCESCSARRAAAATRAAVAAAPSCGCSSCGCESSCGCNSGCDSGCGCGHHVPLVRLVAQVPQVVLRYAAANRAAVALELRLRRRPRAAVAAADRRHDRQLRSSAVRGGRA